MDLLGGAEEARWEGAGDVLDGSGKVIGKSFLELTGYVGDLGEKLR